MPANSRWDLIRRLKVKRTITVTEVKHFTPFIACLKIISVQFEFLVLVQI